MWIVLRGCGGGVVTAPSGTLDTTFGIKGIVTTDIVTGNDFANALAIQPDGKIVVAGYSKTGTDYDHYFAIVRYNADGTLDPTFGTNGIVTTDIDFEGAYALGIQKNGKIAVAGISILNTTGRDFAIVRYNADGTLDTTFGTKGIVITDVGGDDFANALAIQPDGKIVVAGISYNVGTRNDFTIVRYNADGTLDPTFGTKGIVITDVGGNDFASALAIQPDGKIAVAGSSGGDFAIVRYLP